MILFDITRLLTRRHRSSPTGIDRVSLRYLEYFLSLNDTAIYFVQQKKDQMDALSREYVNDYFNQVSENWGIKKTDSIDYSEIARIIIDTPEEYVDVPSTIDSENSSINLTLSDLAMINQFYNKDFQERLAILMNTDISSLLGKHFAWFSKTPSVVKTMIFIIAASSRINALIYMKVGRFIGYIFDVRNVKKILKSRSEGVEYKRNFRNLHDVLMNKDEKEGVTYINTSHYLSLSDSVIDEYSKSYKFKYIFFVHDLLQLESPEYFPRKSYSQFKRFIDLGIRLDSAFIFNSEATKNSFLKYKNKQNMEYSSHTLVNHIGIEKHFYNADESLSASINTNYFVFISTIEPRKNHLLMLNIWRQFYDSGMEDIPKLFVIGSRGWSNENIVDMLELSPGLVGSVFEFNHLNDATLIPLLSNARALLFPSHSEGWGLPVVEALIMKTPVICSDIPVLHEAGQDIPEYIDPMDGIKWMNTIIEYSKNGSEIRKAQLQRMEQFGKPTWNNHYDKLSEFIHSCT